MLELLVIIVATVIFCGIMVMVGIKTTGRNLHRACATNVKDLGAAEVLYAQDHDNVLPPVTNMEATILKIEKKDSALPTDSDQPERLKKILALYVGSEDAWYCPSDPVAKQKSYCLGVRHENTSYAFPLYAAANGAPLKLNALTDDYRSGLVWDAAGDRSSCQSGLWYGGNEAWASNHPDGLVNFVLPDLSLRRAPAEWAANKLVR